MTQAECLAAWRAQVARGKAVHTMPTKTLALATGVPYDALRRALEPGYAEQRRNAVNARRNGLDGAKGRFKADGTDAHVTERRPMDADVAARLAEIPEDTRGITAYLMGDPIPGDRRRQHRQDARAA